MDTGIIFFGIRGDGLRVCAVQFRLKVRYILVRTEYEHKARFAGSFRNRTAEQVSVKYRIIFSSCSILVAVRRKNVRMRFYTKLNYVRTDSIYILRS